MQNIIDTYKQSNHYLAILKEVAKTANGKSLKWLSSKLLKYDICLHPYDMNDSFYREFKITSQLKAVIINGNCALYLFDDQWLDSNGKIIADKLIELINNKMQLNSKEIELMEQNEKNKVKIINKFNNLIDELNTLTGTMSLEFIKKYRHEFKPASVVLENEFWR